MGDYRYFPDKPAPVQGRDPYAHDPYDPRGQGGLRPDPQRYAPPLRGATPYGYGPSDAPDYGYDAPDYVPEGDPYARPTHPHAPAYPNMRHPAVPPRTMAPHAPQMRHDPYAPPPYAGQEPALTGAAPSWVAPRAAHAPHAAHAQRPANATPPLRPAALLHGLGAVMSLGLVVLAGAWTWGMMQRDVSGVPVVRALEGPMRIAPETPGGQQAAFQGLAINELAGAGASSESDAIVLAPPPVSLGDLTAPQTLLPAPAGDGLTPVPLPEGPALGFNTPNRLAVERSPRPRGRDASGVMMAAAPVQSAGSQMPALSTSNDPSAANALAASIAQSVAMDISGPRGIDVDPASIGPGTRLVQLGAYDNADEARGAWDGLSRRFSPLLNDRGRVIEAAHSGGSVFYRLRAHGFSDERDARRFCAALVAEQIDCIPVLVR